MKYILVILLLCLSTSAWNQDIKIHKREIKESFVGDYIKKAERSSNADSIYFFYNRAMLISQELEYHKGEIEACKGLLKLYKKDDDIYEKLRYSLLLVGLYNRHGTHDERAGAYDNLGKMYFDEKLYAKAVEIFGRATELDIQDRDLYYEVNIWLVRSQKHAGDIDDAIVSARRLELKSDRLSLYQKIELQKEKAETYHKLKAFNEELQGYEEIARLVKGTEYSYLEPANWNNIGYTHKYLENFKKAKSAFYSTIRSGATDDELSGGAYYNLGMIYQNVDYPDSALICFTLARNFYKRSKNTEQMAKCFNLEAMVYYQNDDQFNAQKNVLQAIQLAKDNKHPKVLSRAYEVESLIHQDLFEFEMALESYKKYLSIRDSLLTEERNLENKLLFDQYKVEQLEKQLRLIWAENERDVINLARERAEKEAEKERFNRQQRENELRIADLEYKELKALEELRSLQLLEEKLNVENKQKELELIQRDNALKELALEKERLVISENEKEIRLLAQQNELEQQKRLNEEQEFKNTMRLVLGTLLFILLILIGILIAYRQLRKRKKRIEQQAIIIAESKKEIEKEKEKSEGLLLNILPTAVADELKANGSAKPKLYEEVSVGFTDFSGFTMISEKLTPEELVHKLDSIFFEFDTIIERHGLQQIKTIGDAYMFASGLPEPMESHAERIVLAALEIRDYIERHNTSLPPSDAAWKIRIGVHTGPVVAGVIGIKKFAYDIWGDTVNTAARMESSGEVGKVNVSGATYALVKDKFKMEHRGKIAAKNKGEIDMYFVEPK